MAGFSVRHWQIWLDGYSYVTYLQRTLMPLQKLFRRDRGNIRYKEERQRVAVGPGNTHCMFIRQVPLRLLHPLLAHRCC